MRRTERGRIQIWIVLAVVAVGVLIQAVLALRGYMSATATPVHPSTTGVPSVAGPAPAATWSGRVEAGRQIVREALTGQNLPGVSVAVGVKGQLVWAEGFGWADIEERVAVAPDTRFRIGTASVVLTSAAVGLLLEQGRLTLDDPIQAHVPAFADKPWPVTLRQVMAHVAGIRNDGGDEGPLLSRQCRRPIEGLEPFADRSLLFEPGSQFRYSSYGWILVSAAVEAAAGEPFLRYLRKEVFEPLGMDETRGESDDRSGQATSYFPRFAADPHYGLDLMRDLDHSCYAGASGLLSTAPDLVRFGMAMHAGTLLQPATVQTLQTSQRLVSGEETGYGLGWDLETVPIDGRDTRVVGHDGDLLGGPVASLLTLPERGLVVAVLSNTSYADTFAVATRLAQVFAQPDRAGTRQ
jgi:serine beta-lactamase-like protein LACTB, mitochondrial